MFTAQDFLNPDNFITGYDSLNAEYQTQQYNKGLELGKNALVINISVSDVWSMVMKDGSLRTSYERIGYHAGTAALLRGFIDSGAKIVIWRDSEKYDDDGYRYIENTTIQEGN